MPSAPTTVTLPPYTVVQSNVDGKDNVYRVQVGDTLPDKKRSIALARKVADIDCRRSTIRAALAKPTQSTKRIRYLPGKVLQ